ncbi:hypothetical protein KSF78_0004695 [Schistosoma japonicum]|nr:hypothetical protein KSF78_0004695 [Schistosoma japonicum]
MLRTRCSKKMMHMFQKKYERQKRLFTVMHIMVEISMRTTKNQLLQTTFENNKLRNNSRRQLFTYECKRCIYITYRYDSQHTWILLMIRISRQTPHKQLEGNDSDFG